MAKDCEKCDPAVGCQALSVIKEELQQRALVDAVSSERLANSAKQAEGMVDAFEKCLESIDSHTLTLNDGRHEFERMDRDISAVAQAGRTHAKLADGTQANHRTLERDVSSSSVTTMWVQGSTVVAIALLYFVFLSSPMADQLWKSIGKVLGF